ncbi:hypothetical protein VTH06DRAFT_4182 [Thermothelomyces fergusii]
MSYTVFNA